MPPSSPPLTWEQAARRRVAIWGWGIEGQVAWKRLTALGASPVVVDDSFAGDSSVDVLPFGERGWPALQAAEVVIKSPGVSRYRSEVRQLESAGVAVVGGFGLWMEEVDRSRVLLVTGTKGKSTTVSIIGHLLAGLKQRAFIGGNLGVPPYSPDAPGAGDLDWWVIETSSYQATDCWSAPPVLAVTSLHPDHIDWHGSAERYYADKLSICRLPGTALTIANGSDSTVRDHASLLGAKVEWVSAADSAGSPDTPTPAWVKPLGLVGSHNVTNALIARACLVAMGVPGADDDKAMTAAAEGFSGLPSRLHPVGTVGGVEFIDDSLSTNVLPTIAALDAYAGRRVALIAGGFDRGIDYSELATYLRRRQGETLVLPVPDAGSRIVAALKAGGALPSGLHLAEVADEAEAPEAGYQWARPDGVVLLSPAAPSYGRFVDYRERSASFVAGMSRCKDKK